MNNRLKRPEKDTCLVAELHQPPPWNLSLEVKRQESEMVIFDLVDRLLRTTISSRTRCLFKPILPGNMPGLC